MKKFLVSFLSLCMFFVTCYMPVSASDDNEYMSNIQTIELDEEGVIDAFTFHSSADQTDYLVKRYEDCIKVIDLQDNQIKGKAEIKHYEVDMLGIAELMKQESGIGLLSNVDDYEKWTNYYYVKTDTLHISDEASTSVSIITSLIRNAFGTAASIASAVAIYMYNHQYKGLDAKIYWSSNTYCNILIKKRYDYVIEETNEIYRTEYFGATWHGSPYDYTLPAACRILAERY